MGSDVPVHDAPPVVTEQHKDVQRAEGQRLRGEEVSRTNLRGVQAQDVRQFGDGGRRNACRR
jgi:hypothetical protein